MSSIASAIQAAMFAGKEHLGPGSRFATGFEWVKYANLRDEREGGLARAFVLHLGIAHMSYKRRLEVWNNAVEAAQAAEVAAKEQKRKRDRKEAVRVVSPRPAPRTVETTTPPLNDDILQVICALVAPKVTFAGFLEVMKRSMAVKSVEELVHIPGHFRDQRVTGFFPSLGPAETGYFFQPYPQPGPSTFNDGTLTVRFERETGRGVRFPEDQTLRWDILVDFIQAVHEPGLDAPRIPDAAVSFETNLATQAGRLGLGPADVARLTNIHFVAYLSYGCSVLTIQGQNADGCFGGVCRVEAPWLSNRALDVWSGIRVGDRVRLMDVFKRYDCVKDATGVVREIRWLSAATYYVALDVAALTQLVERYHGQTKCAKGAREMTVGQLAGDVACKRYHLKLM